MFPQQEKTLFGCERHKGVAKLALIDFCFALFLFFSFSFFHSVLKIPGASPRRGRREQDESSALFFFQRGKPNVCHIHKEMLSKHQKDWNKMIKTSAITDINNRLAVFYLILLYTWCVILASESQKQSSQSGTQFRTQYSMDNQASSLEVDTNQSIRHSV